MTRQENIISIWTPNRQTSTTMLIILPPHTLHSHHEHPYKTLYLFLKLMSSKVRVYLSQGLPLVCDKERTTRVSWKCRCLYLNCGANVCVRESDFFCSKFLLMWNDDYGKVKLFYKSFIKKNLFFRGITKPVHIDKV